MTIRISPLSRPTFGAVVLGLVYRKVQTKPQTVLGIAVRAVNAYRFMTHRRRVAERAAMARRRADARAFARVYLADVHAMWRRRHDAAVAGRARFCAERGIVA